MEGCKGTSGLKDVLLLETNTTILSLIKSWLELSSEEGLCPAFDLSTARKRISITDPAFVIFVFNIVLDFLIKNNADPRVGFIKISSQEDWSN